MGAEKASQPDLVLVAEPSARLSVLCCLTLFGVEAQILAWSGSHNVLVPPFTVEALAAGVGVAYSGSISSRDRHADVITKTFLVGSHGIARECAGAIDWEAKRPMRRNDRGGGRAVGCCGWRRPEHAASNAMVAGIALV